MTRRPRADAPPHGVPIVDDLTRMRAKRIARAKTPDEIRSAIRDAAQLCPGCGLLMRHHSDEQLDTCAKQLGDYPQGA